MNNKQRLQILKNLRKYLFVEKIEDKYGKYERIVIRHLSPHDLSFLQTRKEYEEIKKWLEDEKEDKSE